jgi:ribosome assembly protein YihI (activator of Der GTPase)
MNEAITLDALGELLHKVQAEQRNLRSDNHLFRSSLTEAVTVLLQRIGESEALFETRFDQVAKRLDRIETLLRETKPNA